MKPIVVLAVLSLSLCGRAQNQQPATLKSMLLEQLRSTHNAKDWFVDGAPPSPG